MQEIIHIITIVKDRIKDSSDMIRTHYDSSLELRAELEGFITELHKGNAGSLEKLKLHFAPTGTFQEHSISNGWIEEYMKLSTRFDEIYQSLKSKCF